MGDDFQTIEESNTINDATKLEAPLQSILPPIFEGRWKGMPTTNVLGPWDKPSFYWGFRAGGPDPETKYDWLMENNLDYRGLCNGIDPTCENEYGWHRYYIEGSGQAKRLTFFCGVATHLHSNTIMGTTGTGLPLWLNHTTNNSAVFCLIGPKNGGVPTPPGLWPTGCEGCDCLRWEIIHNEDDDTLSFTLYLAPPVVHLEVTFSRDGPAPPSIGMPSHKNFSDICRWDGRDSRRVSWTQTKTALHQQASSTREIPNIHQHISDGCPFRMRLNLTSQSSVNATPVIASSTNTSRWKPSLFEFCYEINRKIGLRLEWNFQKFHKKIDVAVSALLPASTEDLYVALGFSGEHKDDVSNYFGMSNSDIVLGYPGCVRTMYAQEYAGAPIDSDNMTVSDTSISIDNNRMTLRFSRPLSTGHHPIPIEDTNPYHNYMILWAVGKVTGDTTAGCQGSFPSYHSLAEGIRSRGMRFISWDRNQEVMADWEKCASE